MSQNDAMAYKTKLNPLCPVALKLGQTEVHAPDHETWESVTCNGCDDQFFVGPNRIYGARITKEKAIKLLESLLAEDHKGKQPHQNSYEIAD